MIRDVLSAVQEMFARVVPPGISAVEASAGATGVVTVDASSAALGSFKVLAKVTTPGAPGVAQVQVSLDGGNNFDQPVLVPAPVAPAVAGLLPLTLPDPSPGNLSQVLSGLVLSCSGDFSVGDTYSFTANAAVTFLFGKHEAGSQDSLFPRIL